jgi:hypothetical protein
LFLDNGTVATRALTWVEECCFWREASRIGTAGETSASSSAHESSAAPLDQPAGIGLAIAKELLAHDYVVFANGRNEERLTKAFAELSGPQRARVM